MTEGKHPFKEELIAKLVYVGKLGRDSVLSGANVDRETFIKIAQISKVAIHADKQNHISYGNKFGSEKSIDFELYMTSWHGIPVFYIAPNE